MFKKMGFAVLFVALTLGMLGCGGSKKEEGASTKTEAPTPTQIVVGLEAEPTTLDCNQISDFNSNRAAMEMFEGLVRFKSGSTELEPCLAESWEISKDGLNYTFHLRQNVKFHDGTPFNADAVKFTYDRQMDKKNKYNSTGQFGYAEFTFGTVQKVTVVDPNTVIFTLKKSFAPFLANLAMHSATIVSPAAVEKYGKDFSKNPVGTGPYKFVKWETGVEVIIEKNPDYWGEKAKVDKIIFKPITDPTTRITELESGNIDFMVGVAPDDLSRIEADGNYTVQKQPGMHLWWTALNTQKKPFNDVRVRQAFNYAVNRESIVKNILKDTGVLAKSPLPPVIWSHTDDVTQYPYNPEKAKQLLKEAGYPNGLEITYWVPETGSGMQQPTTMATAIQADLAKVGVKVKIQTMEWGTYLDKVLQPPAKSDMLMHAFSWIGDNGDPDNFLYILFSGKQFPTDGFNDSYYNNPKLNQILEQARTEVDKNKRTALYVEAQKIITADAPYIMVDHETQIVAMKKNITGFQLHPTGVFRFRDVSISK